jgi:hypothetical protein
VLAQRAFWAMTSPAVWPRPWMWSGFKIATLADRRSNHRMSELAKQACSTELCAFGITSSYTNGMAAQWVQSLMSVAALA